MQTYIIDYKFTLLFFLRSSEFKSKRTYIWHLRHNSLPARYVSKYVGSRTTTNEDGLQRYHRWYGETKMIYELSFDRCSVSKSLYIDIQLWSSFFCCYDSLEFSLHPSISENVMVVTFGRDVKVIQSYSNDFRTISRCVGNTIDFSCLSSFFSNVSLKVLLF